MHIVCSKSGNSLKFLIVFTLSSFAYVCVTENVEQENSASNADWFSFVQSPVQLFYLCVIEEDIFKIVKNHVAQFDREPEIFFRRYIADYEESTLRAYEDLDDASIGKRKHVIHTNPLLAHRMIWRYVTDLPKIKQDLISSGKTEMMEKLHSKPHLSFIWPSEQDLNSSMDSLLNLHYIYNLNISEFADGNISGVITNANLAAVHCFEIAQFALHHNKQYTLAFAWLEVADTKRMDPNGHPILDFLEEEPILKLLEEIIQGHDAVWEDESSGFNNVYQFYNKIDSDYVLTPHLSVLQSEYTRKGDGVKNLSLNDFTAFSTLCKGGNLQSPKEKSKLFCWYESKIHPAFYINPQKMELHSKEPYIFQVYDFIGNEFIRYLKYEAIPLMERSQVTEEIELTDVLSENRENDRQTGTYSQTRTSMYSWLDEDDHAKLVQLSKNIGYLTGLSTSFGSKVASSSFQVAVYATGGYFNIHIDSLEDTEDFQELINENIGDRLATFMLYLNNLELGGHTAFTSAGVGVQPVRGSAVFWYDSLYNGEVDYRVWHGGCPVLLGEKWVANKWIHQYSNIFKRKCTLKKTE